MRDRSWEVGRRRSLSYSYLGIDWRLRRIVTPDGPVTEQAIAAARLRLQQAPVRTERLADCRRVNMKRVFHDNSAGPDTVHQLVFGHKFASRLGQNFDDLKGAPTNWYRRSKNPKFAASKVDLALA
jgi:hypothetical protein